MPDYTTEELTEALRAVSSVIHKCEKAQEKFPEGSSHHTLLRNRLKAMHISGALISERLSEIEKSQAIRTRPSGDCGAAELLSHLNALHTTDLGAQRIKKNLNLTTGDVTGWCKEKIKSPKAVITRKGKNWYIADDSCVVTVNAHSYTIITAHPKNIRPELPAKSDIQPTECGL